MCAHLSCPPLVDVFAAPVFGTLGVEWEHWLDCVNSLVQRMTCYIIMYHPSQMFIMYISVENKCWIGLCTVINTAHAWFSSLIYSVDALISVWLSAKCFDHSYRVLYVVSLRICCGSDSAGIIWLCLARSHLCCERFAYGDIPCIMYIFTLQMLVLSCLSWASSKQQYPG